jgi:hypothetical protein
MAKNTKVATLLKNARSIIARGWCRTNLATDANGKRVTVKNPKAKSFCAIGALRRAEHVMGTTGVATEGRKVLRSVLPASCFSASVVSFNDYGTKQEVLKLFDRAIDKVSK